MKAGVAMLAKIGWYLLFLVAIVGYFALIAYVQYRQQRILTQNRGSVFIGNQLGIISGLIPIAVIPWILTGFFRGTFLLLIVAAFELSALLTYGAYYLFRLTQRRVAMRTVLVFGELGLKHPILGSLLLILFGLVTLGGYFVIATYVYVVNPLHSDSAVHEILLLNLALFFGGVLVAAIPSIAQIASPQIDDRTRAAFFVSQMATSLQIGIMLTVYLGLVGIGTERFVPVSIRLPAGYAQYVPALVLTAFSLVALVIPYFAGMEGRRRAEISLNTTILDSINKIIDAVGIPGEDDLDQLKQLRDEFVHATADWIEGEPIVKELAIKVDHPMVAEPLNPNLEALVEPYRAFKNQDLRFVRLNWSDGMKLKFDEMIDEYDRFAAQPARVRMFFRLGQAYATHFRDERGRYESKLKEAEERKIIAPVLARLIPVLGSIPVVVQYGKVVTGVLLSLAGARRKPAMFPDMIA